MKTSFLLSASLCICSCALQAKTPDVDSVGVARFRDGKKAAISFTFDDSIDDHYNLVAPQLEKYGFRGTFWVIGNSIDRSGALSSAQIREMSDRGHEMSNHTWSHQRLADMDTSEVVRELRMTDDALEKITGRRPVALAFPFNHWNDTVMAISMRGRVDVRRHQFAMGQKYRHSTPEKLSSWLKQTIGQGDWGIAMIHGIHHGWDAWDDETVLWNFFAETAAHGDDVWVGTFSEVAAYVKERESCSVSYEVKGHRLLVTPQCDLDHGLFRENLTLAVVVDGERHFVDFDPFAGRFKINLRRL